MNRPFRRMLTERQREVNSLLCVGLDPLMESLPGVLKDSGKLPYEILQGWLRDIVEATAPFASMFKLQHAHYEAIPGGLRALRGAIFYIHEHHPTIPVFVDCKRGDIDRTQAQYAATHLGFENADAMNYNGYMGISTLKALVDPAYAGRGLVGLGRTSNPDAWEFQDALLSDGVPVWQRMVMLQHRWSVELGVIENAGIVMGAAHKDPQDPTGIPYSDHLSTAREMVGDSMWFLIPGVGTQGGFVEETVRASFVGAGSISVNSSSGIIFASKLGDFAEAAAAKAMELRDQLRAAGGSCS